MAEWTVQLGGDAAVLRWMADTLDDPSISIEQILGSTDNWQLKSAAFAAFTDEQDVFNAGSAILTRISGMAALYGLNPSDVIVSAVMASNSDGSGLGSALLPFHFDVLPGTTQKYQVSDLPTNDSNVEVALRVLAQRRLTWSELYKLLEIVQADQGSDYPIREGVTTKVQLRNFKHTANSMAAIGDDARHGPTSQQPPSSPMTIDDARDLLRDILKHWFGEKRVLTP